MAGERFLFGAANQYFHLMNFRQIVEKGIDNRIDRCLLVDHPARMVDRNRTREVHKQNTVFGHEYFLKLRILGNGSQ